MTAGRDLRFIPLIAVGQQGQCFDVDPLTDGSFQVKTDDDVLNCRSLAQAKDLLLLQEGFGPAEWAEFDEWAEEHAAAVTDAAALALAFQAAEDDIEAYDEWDHECSVESEFYDAYGNFIEAPEFDEYDDYFGHSVDED